MSDDVKLCEGNPVAWYFGRIARNGAGAVAMALVPLAISLIGSAVFARLMSGIGGGEQEYALFAAVAIGLFAPFTFSRSLAFSGVNMLQELTLTRLTREEIFRGFIKRPLVITAATMAPIILGSCYVSFKRLGPVLDLFLMPLVCASAAVIATSVSARRFTNASPSHLSNTLWAALESAVCGAALWCSAFCVYITAHQCLRFSDSTSQKLQYASLLVLALIQAWACSRALSLRLFFDFDREFPRHPIWSLNEKIARKERSEINSSMERTAPSPPRSAFIIITTVVLTGIVITGCGLWGAYRNHGGRIPVYSYGSTVEVNVDWFGDNVRGFCTGAFNMSAITSISLMVGPFLYLASGRGRRLPLVSGALLRSLARYLPALIAATGCHMALMICAAHYVDGVRMGRDGFGFAIFYAVCITSACASLMWIMSARWPLFAVLIIMAYALCGAWIPIRIMQYTPGIGFLNAPNELTKLPVGLNLVFAFWICGTGYDLFAQRIHERRLGSTKRGESWPTTVQ